MSGAYTAYREYFYVGGMWTGGHDLEKETDPPPKDVLYSKEPANPTDAAAREHDWQYDLAQQARDAGQEDVARQITINADLALAQ
jgi:hypothetical protein